MPKKKSIKSPRSLDLLHLLGFIILCEAAGLVGTIFTIQSIPTWYSTLIKPSFSPPNFIFGPVWTILYLLMGVSLFLVWRSKKSKDRTRGLQLFTIQLLLNAVWTIIFFGFQSPFAAFVEIAALWIVILLTIKSFLKVSKTASYLLIPYIVWVSFALFLNLSIVLLNP